MFSKKLQKIGLTYKEAKIYTSLLELGETNIQRISNKSKIKRTTIYNIIEVLKEKGLISIVLKKRRKYYMAADPRELESKLEEQKQILKSILPELLSISNLIDKKPRIKFFEGEEGLKKIYLDTLNYPEQPVWGWLANDVFTDYFDKEFVNYYVSKRVNNKIISYVIATNTPETQKFKTQDKKILRETKIDLKNNLNIKVEINLYGNNKIAILSFYERFGLIIESQKIYNTLKSIFDVSWKNLE